MNRSPIGPSTAISVIIITVRFCVSLNVPERDVETACVPDNLQDIQVIHTHTLIPTFMQYECVCVAGGTEEVE